MNQKDIRLDLLRKLEINPGYTQRDLSKEMGVSLGKVNYCIKKLTEKGWLKIIFTHNPNKIGYAYLLTQSGIEEKSRLTCPMAFGRRIVSICFIEYSSVF